MKFSRRSFLRGVAGAGAVGGLGSFEALWPLSPADAAAAAVTPEMVRFTDEIEPIVRLIEATPRDEAVEVMAREIRKGLAYQPFLAALFLAGIRNINPQPPGFKFHCVFIIHSANYLSQMGPPEERLLPLFYALDDFKNSQKQDEAQGDFILKPAEGTLPSASKAWAAFHSAMEDWDEGAADLAITALAREKGPEEIFEGLWAYGARDYRNIGHKAIFVANAWRTLETIGWQHAEPALRSIVLGLLDFGKSKKVNGYRFEDQAYLSNVERVKEWADRMPGSWNGGEANRAITLEVLALLRMAAIGEACDLAMKRLSEGTCQAQAIWDAVHLAASEMMMRQPGLIGVHTVTSTNALRYGFHASGRIQTRLLMLLQGIGWMGQFRTILDGSRDKDMDITNLEPADIPERPDRATEAILAAVSSNRREAAAMAYAYGRAFPGPELLFDRARHLVFTKTREHHQFKWPAAIFEDYHLVSPEWRPHMLATSMYYLRGTGHGDSPVIKRAVKSLQLA